MIRRRPSPSTEARFEELVNDHARAVATYARSVASTPTIAEDAVQETFLRAWRYLDSFRGSGSREGWLIRICRNAVYDLEARERRNLPGRQTDVVRLDTDRLGQELLVDAGSSPVDEMAGLQLVELLARLPLAQREVVVLCGVLGYSYEAAADVLDTPVGTIRSRLSRARHALRDLDAPGRPPDSSTDRVA